MVAATGHIGADVLRWPAGEQQAAHHRPKRSWIDRRADARRDRLRRRVRLLCRDPALLDRVAGRVAGGVHVVLAWNEPVRTDGNEAPGVLREARQAWPTQVRQADDAVGLDGAPGHHGKLAGAHLGGVSSAVEADAALAEEVQHDRRGGRREQLERPLLRGHDGELDVAQAPIRRVCRSHESQLVERKWPRRARWNRERDVVDSTLVQVAQQLAEPVRVAGTVQRHASRERHGRPRAYGDEE